MDAASFAQMERLLRDDTAGEFEIIRPLGRGGMAMVYLGREIHLARHVAIKVLPPELTFGHGVERFKREAKTAAALDHPNIIPIYRVASGGKIFWYAMKYLEGRSLEDLLKQQERIPLKDTISILTQVADALDYAHEHKVIHRDVKPANVMLDARGRVVVTDFGIAKALTEGTLTASGSVIGTPYFMSPEQGMGRAITGASDQYSVAVMAYRMLTGHVPFEGDSAIEILHKHCTQPAPPIDVIGSGLPRSVASAVHKALEKHPEDRFATVSTFVQALKQQAPPDMETTDAATIAMPRPAVLPSPRAKVPGAAPAAARKPTRWKPAAVGVGVLAVVGGVGAAVLLSNDSAPPPRPVATQPAESVRPAVPPPAAAAVDTTPAPPAPGRVTITGLPSRGTVTVDGRRQPGASFELTPGRHEVRLEASGYEADVRTVTVAPRGVARVAFAGRAVRPPPVAAQPAAPQPAAPAPGLSPSVLRVSVSPAANVFVDDVDRGQRSRFEETVVPGTHTLRLVREGFVTKDTTITLEAGATVLLRLTLTERRP
jgi:serine/threonine-protein kinase